MNPEAENAAFLSAINNGGGRVVELIYADFLDEHARPDEAALLRADRQDSFPPAVAQTMRARWDGGFGGWWYGGSGGSGGSGGDGGSGGYGGYGGDGGYGGSGGYGGDGG